MDIKQETNEENVCGSEKLLLGDLIQQGLDKVSITSPSANDGVKLENEVVEVKTEVNDGVQENEVMEVKSEVKNEDESESSDDDDDESDLTISVLLFAQFHNRSSFVLKCCQISFLPKDLPLVPPVTVTIQPHHQTLPVGVVLSIMGAQVIVEGVDNHKPLSEGSILWITECRSPLGVVDEIFGPVKNPYYIVRFNSESEVPAGIEQGSLISFVPEFADYVLNNNNLYQKGYDASGANDEELSEELEFSDDEKEAEYKKMKKMSKRGSSEQKNGNTKKDKKSKNRRGNSKINPQPSPNTQVSGSSSSGPTSGPQAFSSGPQAPNFNGPQPSGVWKNGFPAIQPQNMGFPPNMFSSNLPFMQPNMMQQPFQNIGLPNFTPFNTQFNNSGQMFPSNFVQGVPPNFGVNPAFASWPAGMPQNIFNQSLLNQSQVGPAGMPQNNFNQLQVRPSGMPQNNFNQSQVGPAMVFQSLPQGAVIPNAFQMENNGAVRPTANSGTSQNTNRGNGFSNRGGKKSFQRGGGRFRGGRSGPQSRRMAWCLELPGVKALVITCCDDE
ncbi:H/ACA ribonucleoprotein complex, subunit Gar1/Naf1 [Artemisia annua]|uniref:H/ACA ribonucleoprotein complex non-core subunit NAF1 n=1 Tax=Artemisia annua TaxID=35608 RepID=A0A2U1N0C4_ARTAN|nr:H/ACA ribonucleoprotein complex, subunit Gar1/Naf1 [Artemisia annua]